MNAAPPDTAHHLEALKLVKEWSQGLVLVQSAAIGVIGALLKQPPSGWHLLVTLLLLACLVFSIWVGAVGVSGTVPSIAQRLPTLLARDPHLDIYAQKGGLTGAANKVLGKSLGDQCIQQSNSFILSLVLFSLFILSLSS
jgi:hypothetical protein